MSSIKVQSISSINTLSASYQDSFLQYTQYNNVYEQGFSLNKIAALTDTVDTSINNYTSQYLTGPKNLTDIFTTNSVELNIKTLTTPIYFATLNGNMYAHFYSSANTDLNVENVGAIGAVLSANVINRNNLYFELEFVDENFLRVIHNDGVDNYYLNVAGGDLAFYSYTSNVTQLTAERNDMFRYTFDPDGFVILYKTTYGSLSVVNINDTTISLSPVSSNVIKPDMHNLMHINNSFVNIAPKINSSWISYDANKLNALSINAQKSREDIEGQFLLHTSYNSVNNAIEIDFVTLNTIRSEKNHIKRGSNKYTANSQNVPDVVFREYTSLYTGNDQEGGNDNITLTYVWYDKDILVKPGADTFFTAPSSLYPYEKLNINDTKFVSNGSFGGKTPVLSDRIYQQKTLNTDFDNTGRYLCTWLSGGDSNTQGVWVDRYYYPDIFFKAEKLGDPIFSPSFETNIDTTSFFSKREIAAHAFFDKKSDLCIIPNAKYKYTRVGSTDIANVVADSEPALSSFNGVYSTKNTFTVNEQNELKYNGTFYNKLNVSDVINNNHSFTISFDAFIDPSKRYGYQILGNLTDSGFGVINDAEITPFVYIHGDETLKIYNTDLTLINSITFDNKIVDVIHSKNLDRFLVICVGGYVYTLNTLGIKLNLTIIPEVADYINYYTDENTVTFLLNESGECAQIDKNTLSVTPLTSTTFNAVNITQLPEQRGLIKKGDTIYGVPGQHIRYVDPNTVFYLVNNEAIIKQDIATTYLTQYISSSSAKIIDFNIDNNDNLLLLHNNTKLSIYDQSRKHISTTDFSDVIGLSSVAQSVNIVKEYRYGESYTYNLISYIDSDQNVCIYNSGLSASVVTGLTGTQGAYAYNVPYADRNRHKLTGFNYYKQFESESDLTFRITLVNYLSAADRLTHDITVNLDDIDKGYHTFTYRFDSLQGNITLFVDGNLHENIQIQPGKYNIQNILTDDIFVGTVGFYNGVDLATYLKQPGQYYIKDIFLRNPYVYNRPISNTEVSALNLLDETINDIVLSVPAGQRNNIEEIERYFKFAPVASSSKQIDIYVKNSGINDVDLQNNIKNLIMSDVRTTLPVGVTINTIKFIDFK